MKIIGLFFIFLTTVSCGITQTLKPVEEMETIPYAEIPDYPTTYSSGNVLGRMIDGLGYRYYWATDSLTSTDLEYNISEDSRSCEYTLDHIHGLSKFILSVVISDPSIRENEDGELEWSEKRKLTLHNFKTASDRVKQMNEKTISELQIVFTRGEKVTKLPFWHVINGPISDAIYHVGQIVTYRRASGNPLNPSVSVFMGKNRG